MCWEAPGTHKIPLWDNEKAVREGSLFLRRMAAFFNGRVGSSLNEPPLILELPAA
jgi:hypothetical protein